MKVEIKVIPNAKKSLIKEDNDCLRVYLHEPPVEGKANKALIEILAKYYNVRKRQIQIIKGLKSRNKTIIIGD